jgi:hypothetical protein
MVTPESDTRRSHRAFFEVFLAILCAVALVLGLYAFGRAVDDDGDGGVAATADGTTGDRAQAAAAPVADGHDHEADANAEAVGDRGFAALDNGEQHDHTFTQPVTTEDRAELGRQLSLAREVALQYPTVADAEAAGLRRAGPFSPGLGAHYIAFGNALGNADGVMSDDDLRKPLAWMYDGTTPDARVVGLFYMSGHPEPEGFAGPNDVWHTHSSTCIKTGADGVIDTPLGADRDATKEQCDAVDGTLIEQTQNLLHVWVVPGFESPEGVFAHLSSAVTCDDGTYETIADVTKIGTAKTICLDGTE